MPGFIDLTALDLQEEVPQGSVDTAGETQARIKYAAGEILVSRSGDAYLPLAFSSGAGSAWIDGGNNFTSIGIFGTQNALPVAFVTSNVERARLTAAGEFLIGATAVSGTESLRVSGGGALVDGTQFAANVSATCSINNSGGPINIGSAANAQAINIGTGAAARPITIGNGTAGTSVSLQAPSIGLGSSNLLSINNSGGAINIGNNADAQAINVGTGASARTITVGNNTAGTTLTARAPIVNVAASTAIQVNGSAGAAGQVLTSQGAGSPAIWAAAGASPLTLVSTTTLAGVNSATISGLDGDTAGLYFITGALKILGGAGVPDGTLIMRLNGANTQYFSSATGYTSGAATTTGVSLSEFQLHPSTWCGGNQGGQIIFSAWLQASTAAFAGSYRSITGTSQLWQTSGSENGITTQFGGTWKGAGNLTSITISNTQALLLLTGPVSIYRLSRT